MLRVRGQARFVLKPNEIVFERYGDCMYGQSYGVLFAPNLNILEKIMKKLSIIVAAAAVAASAALPVAAQTKTSDPFVSTQALEVSPLIVVATSAVIVGIAASVDGDNSSSGSSGSTD
jgi:hypothetical protein